MFQINWKLKALLYKVFEYFKLKKTIYFIQKYITKRSKIYIDEVGKHWLQHAQIIKKYNCKNVLEIGAGKSLEQNIYLAYHFDKKIHQTAIDINPMLDFELFNNASKEISILLRKKFKGKITSIEDLQIKYNIFYRSPYSLEDLIKSRTKFDICISTTTLEHFSLEDLNNFLNKINYVLNNKKLVSSIIDYSDHYAHTDKKITYLNFLKYNSDDWKKYNNTYLFQNRLRHQDYRKIFKNNDFKIIEENEGEFLPKINRISSEFDKEDRETYLSWGYYLVSRIVNPK